MIDVVIGRIQALGVTVLNGLNQGVDLLLSGPRGLESSPLVDLRNQADGSELHAVDRELPGLAHSLDPLTQRLAHGLVSEYRPAAAGHQSEG